MGTVPSSPTIPEQLTADLEVVVEPEALLDVRRVGTEQSRYLQALLKWKNLPDYEATWEDVTAINNRFPEFHLEDKVLVWGQGNVMNCTKSNGPLHMYTRRKKDKSGKGTMVI